MWLNCRHFFAHYAICISSRYAHLFRRRERHTAGRWARGRRHYDYARARRQIRRIEKNFLGKNRTSICFHEDIRKPCVTRACPGPIEPTILRRRQTMRSKGARRRSTSRLYCVSHARYTRTLTFRYTTGKIELKNLGKG